MNESEIRRCREHLVRFNGMTDTEREDFAARMRMSASEYALLLKMQCFRVENLSPAQRKEFLAEIGGMDANEIRTVEEINGMSVAEVRKALTDNAEDEDSEVVIDPNMGLRRVYDYLPYSHWRLKEILNDRFNAHPVLIRAYKEGRYPGYKQHYDIRENGTNRLIREHVYLDDLRRLFAGMDIPLSGHTERNMRAEDFLRTVRNIAKEQRKEK